MICTVIPIIASPSSSSLPQRTPTAQAKHDQDQSNNTHMACELWRRALLDCDERAWQVVYGNHQRQVHSWVNAQLRFSVDAPTRQRLIDDAFLKMAGTFTRHPEKFADYPNQAALLGLLRCCAQRVVQAYVTALAHELPLLVQNEIHEPIASKKPTQTDLSGVQSLS